jgi:hypothetical protein
MLMFQNKTIYPGPWVGWGNVFQVPAVSTEGCGASGHFVARVTPSGHWDRPAFAYRFHTPSFSRVFGRGISIKNWATALSDATACGVDSCGLSYDESLPLQQRTKSSDDYIPVHNLKSGTKVLLSSSTLTKATSPTISSDVSSKYLKNSWHYRMFSDSRTTTYESTASSRFYSSSTQLLLMFQNLRTQSRCACRPLALSHLNTKTYSQPYYVLVLQSLQ